jgi:hypothetical protein
VVLGRVLTGGFSGDTIFAKRGGGETALFYDNAGVAVIEDATSNVVIKVFVFTTQITGPEGQEIWVPPLQLGGSIGNVTLGTSTFLVDQNNGPIFFGDTREVTLTSGVTFRVVSSSIHGVSLAGACDSSPCADSTVITAVAIADPSAAKDVNSLGLGSSQADVESVFGAGTTDSHGVVVYAAPSLANPLGVIYQQDLECTPRAAVLVLGYDTATSFDVFFQ